MLYDNKDFILLRKKYRNNYGEYPTSLVEKYKSKFKPESIYSRYEVSHFGDKKFDREMEILKRDFDIVSKYIESLLKELDTLVSK